MSLEPKVVNWEEGFDLDRNQVYINSPKGKAFVTISSSHMPENCAECPLYNNNVYYDEDALFGDGYFKECPFGADSFGCLVKRPDNCPLCLKI